MMNTISFFVLLTAQLPVFGALVFIGLKLRARFQHMDVQFLQLSRQYHALYDGRFEPRLDSLAREIQNSAALNAIGFRFPVFFGGWSVDSFLARRLVQYLMESKPALIVELGSGSSTILIAKCMQNLGHRDYEHLAVDHEARYLALTKQSAQLNGIEDRIQFLECQLQKLPGTEVLWYGGLISHLEGKQIDLLVVDGPPGALQKDSRYPTLLQLLPYLSANCTVILDDTSRTDEAEIASRWANSFPGFNLEINPDGHGHAVLTRNGANQR
jgi:predicted O-methyltransferase YrrM